jgi:hypothetical protein
MEIFNLLRCTPRRSRSLMIKENHKANGVGEMRYSCHFFSMNNDRYIHLLTQVLLDFPHYPNY